MQKLPARKIRLLLLGFLFEALLGISVLGHQLAATQSARSHYQQAQNYFRQGDLRKAKEQCDSALRFLPRMVEAEHLLGLIAQASGQLLDAEAYFFRVLRTSPEYIPAHFNLATNYLRLGKPDLAKQSLAEVLRLDSSHAPAHYHLGVILRRAKTPAKAISHFEKARQLNSGNFEYLVGLLECQLDLGRQSEADESVAAINQLLDGRDPRRSELGALLANRGAYRLCIEIYKKSLEADPDSYEVQFNLALSVFLVNDTKSAAAVLTRILLQRKTAEVHNLLARVYEKSGSYLEALNQYQRATMLEPFNEDFRFDYCLILVLHNALDEGISQLKKATQDFPKSARFWATLGAANYINGDSEQAVHALLRSITIAPDLTQSYYYLGRSQSKVHPLLQKRIMEKLKRYLSLNPDDPWANLFYGAGLIQGRQTGDTRLFLEAEAYLRKATKLSSALAEASFQLGLLYNQQGKITDSIVEFQRAAKANPDMYEAHYRLAIAYSKIGQKEKAQEASRLQQKLREKVTDEKEKRRNEFFEIVQTAIDSGPK